MRLLKFKLVHSEGGQDIWINPDAITTVTNDETEDNGTSLFFGDEDGCTVEGRPSDIVNRILFGE